jgi:hypothetical protein
MHKKGRFRNLTLKILGQILKWIIQYFENVAQEQQGPARRQRRQPARFRDDAGAGIGAQLAQLQANRATR